MIDVLVVGGGPVGLATALHAARAGLSVTVVEAREAPLDKACGEGLMPGAVAHLAGLGVRPDGRLLRGIRYTDGRRSVEAGFAGRAGLGVRRTELHARLSEAVASCGVEVVRARVDDVSQDATGVTAAGLRARYLLAADGLHSAVRRCVGLALPARGPRRWGVRAHYAVAPWSEHVEVYWGAAGEAYVTPVAPDCVGVALLGGERLAPAERLDAFPALAARLPGPSGRVLGAGPLRQASARRVAGRVALVGDAAGYVDALTGEGLATGFACGAAAVGRLAAGRLVDYERDWARLTRRHRLLTAALVSATARPPVRSRLVPVAARVPWLFEAAVRQAAVDVADPVRR